MARKLLKIEIGILILLVLFHLFNAYAWGNWDQEGTGSLGFWKVFWEAGFRMLWLYVLVIVITVVTWSFCIEPKQKYK